MPVQIAVLDWQDVARDVVDWSAGAPIRLLG
jgi:hypothetical protein